MKKMLTVIFTLLFVSAFPLAIPSSLVPSIYYLNNQTISAGDHFTLIGGVPLAKIRLLSFVATASAGTCTLSDSTTGTVIASGQSFSANGLIELSVGSNLTVSCTDDCTLTLFVNAAIN